MRLCENCYPKIVKASGRGRESFKKQHGKTWGQMQYEISQRLRECQNSEKSSHLSGSLI